MLWNHRTPPCSLSSNGEISSRSGLPEVSHHTTSHLHAQKCLGYFSSHPFVTCCKFQSRELNPGCSILKCQNLPVHHNGQWCCCQKSLIFSRKQEAKHWRQDICPPPFLATALIYRLCNLVKVAQWKKHLCIILNRQQNLNFLFLSLCILTLFLKTILLSFWVTGSQLSQCFEVKN